MNERCPRCGSGEGELVGYPWGMHGYVCQVCSWAWIKGPNINSVQSLDMPMRAMTEHGVARAIPTQPKESSHE
jgi:hypothetical protein